MTPADIVFLPGLDGAAELREPFVQALRAAHPVRSVGYPNRALGGLEAYWRHAAGSLDPAARRVLVAESFSGLVAARWAAADARVAAIVLCGAFARNPVGWVAGLGAKLPAMARLGARMLGAIPAAGRDPVRLQWSRAFTGALAALDDAVLAERLALIASEDVSADLGSLPIPVVLVQFERDLVVRARERARLEGVCHNAQVVRFPGPHFAIEVQPLQCALAIGGRIRAVLDEHRPEPGAP